MQVNEKIAFQELFFKDLSRMLHWLSTLMVRRTAAKHDGLRSSFPYVFRVNPGPLGQTGGALLAALVAIVFVASPVIADEAEETAVTAAEEVESGGLPYEVSIQGTENEEVLNTLNLLSSTVSRKDKPPPGTGLLHRRAEKDIPELVLALRSMGHYDAAVEYSIDENQAPMKVVFQVTMGTLYKIRSVEIACEDPTALRLAPTPAQLGLTAGMPAVARKILEAGNALVEKIKTRGYPFAQVDDPKVVVDHASEDVTVTYSLNAGPAAKFGETTVEGLKSVEGGYVALKIPWKKGDSYDERLIQEANKQLSETRLFSLIRISHAEVLDEAGLLPMKVELTERKPRTVKAGISYKTDEGIGATASWEHRNLFHEGERLKASLIVSQITRALEGAFEKSDYLSKDQSLNAALSIADEDTDAYESQNVEGFVVIRRPLAKGLKVSAGPGFRVSKVDDQDTGDDNFVLFSFPGQLDWDYSNNLLDPTRGGRFQVRMSPYLNTLEAKDSFFKGYVSYSHYVPLLDRPSLLFAGRAALGSITGTARDSIPADLRMYAGGGGSIRGYPYQSVSPLDEDGDPIGGRSLMEFSAELRWKITPTIGVVTFFDGGGAFEASYPDFGNSLRYGAGAGIRYYTPLGPLRFDVGVPLNKREGIDEAVQFYISLGQAF